MRPALLALALLAAPLAATAQDAPADTVTLRPGDPSLVTDWLAEGSRTTTMKLTQPQKMDVGTSTDTYTMAGGQVTRVTTLSVPMRGMNQTDTVTADAVTLAPRRHQSAGGMAEVSLEFMDEGVAGLVTPRTGEARTVMVETDAPVFDGAWIGEIVRSLPFAASYVAKVPVYLAQAGDEPVDVVLSVTGQEPTASGPAWTVEADMGAVTMTYVVDATTRDLVVTRMSPQPGVAIEMVPAQ